MNFDIIFYNVLTIGVCMKLYSYDCVVVGGGAAGMAAALEVKRNNFSVAIIEREEFLGGILLQCIHNGFGLHEFKEELTGPEYAERFETKVLSSGVEIFLETTAVDIKNRGSYKEIYAVSKKYGGFIINSKAVVLSMGCRERNRGNIGIPGSRPAGVFTAGLAQRLVNIEGYVPGKEIVVVGSGDIGLIMARRMTWSGCKVKAVIEIQPYPSGLPRNIALCLNDFDIPLHLNSSVINIHGKERVERLDIVTKNPSIPEQPKYFSIDCDTVLLSVGLIPENELSKKAGIQINPENNGPYVDSFMTTNVEGIFACGNALHVHDLVDFVTEESRRTGNFVSRYLNNDSPIKQYKIKAGANVRYVTPQKINPGSDNTLYLRPMIVKDSATLNVAADDKIIYSKNLKYIRPSEMIKISLLKENIGSVSDIEFEISLA